MIPVALAFSIPNELAAALVGGAVLLTNAAVAYGIWWIQKQMKENRDNIEENTKLTKDVKTLVNSQHGALLSRSADSMEALARVTEDPSDMARAESARAEADQHEKDTVKEKTQHQPLEVVMEIKK